MQDQFPQIKNRYLKTSSFQDTKITLTYKGWEYVANEDDPSDSPKKVKQTWKEKTKYCLSYSWPEFQVDRDTLEFVMDDQGQKLRNSNYKPEYPHGYSIRYYFNEGELESGSYPLFRGFCQLQPKVGEKVVIGKTGEKTETVWTINRLGQENVPITGETLPDYPPEEAKSDLDIPF